MANKITLFIKNIKNTFSKFLMKNTNFKNILHNTIFLYLVFALSLVNLFLLSNTGNYVYVTVFVLIGFITSFFSKNMVVILLLPLILTNILKYGSSLNEGFEEKGEGFEEGAENKEDDEGFEEGAENKEEDEGFEEGAENKEDDTEDTESKEKKSKKELKELQNSANELLTNISSLNNTIQKFSNFDFAK